MARRKKGRPISGWVIVDKPAGIGSTDIVGKVRWAFEAQKAGHAGTLDPDATGVLAIALGEATKTIPFVTDALKAYRFAVRWGAETSTDDAAGEVVTCFDSLPDPDAIEKAVPQFVGDIEQVPPKVSAVKVSGQRAYDLARENEAFELAPRPLYVETLTVENHPDPQTTEMTLVCGKGGYVRAIARDLGQALGCGGHVLWLRRVWSGPFEVAQAVTLDQIEAAARTPEIDDLLLPLEIALADLPEARLTPAGLTRVRNGNPGDVGYTQAGFGEVAWGSDQGRAVAIGTYMSGQLHPSRVINQ